MKKIVLLFLSLLSFSVFSQSVDVGLTDYSSYLIERQAILSGNEDKIFLNLKPYDRLNVAEVAHDISEKNSNNEIDYILDENEMFLYSIKGKDTTTTSGFSTVGKSKELLRESNSSFWKYFYKTPAQFLQLDKNIEGRNYRLRVNPILHLKAGPAGNNNYIFRNTRGVQVDLSLDERLYISSNIIETQARFPGYVNNYIDRYKAVPKNGFYKNYNSSVFSSQNAYDFLNSTAKIGFNLIPSIGLEFGYGKNQIGHGIRSLALSDFSDNYMFLGLNTKIGRLAYRNIFGELRASSTNLHRSDPLVPKKYFASHYLGYKVLPNLQIGLFETVVFSRQNNFEFHYMNPVILYRTVEGAIGSPDNVMLGIDARWDFLNHFSFYGQLVFDEFKVDELIFDNQNWWANKYSYQVGMKAFDIFKIKGLDAQIEFNSIRPFMYSHRDSSSTWTHGNQSLAHPLGANLEEQLLKLRYRPSLQWSVEITGMLLNQGISPAGFNFGDDPRIPNTTRSKEYGNTLLQGINKNVSLINMRLSYMIWHGAFLDLTIQNRDSNLEEANQYISLGFRWNASSTEHLF